MGIQLTEQAAEHIRQQLDARDHGIGVRIGVTPSGCSGMSYLLEFVDQLNEEDQVFEKDGAKVIIDAKSLPYLEGTQLDFVREGLNEGLKFNNPNVKAECGCGESFTV